MLALWAEQDVIVADEFRDGNVPAGSGNRCQRRSGDPTWVMLQSLNKRQAPCPKLPTFPHVIDLDRYDESPAAACVALGIPSRNRSSQS